VSFAAITYVGFDGLTTLAEDSVNPRRDMVRATVLVVAITGILNAVEMYFLHSVMPDWQVADPNTSYLDVMRIVGGSLLFTTFLGIMAISQFGSGFGVQVNAARLLYGMGRDGALPWCQNAARNILIVGVLAFLGTLLVDLDQGLDLLNFGAFLGYMGVNVATIWSYYVHPPEGHHRSLLRDLVLPTGGFVGCLLFWIGLPQRAKIVGGVWLLAGLMYAAYKTRFFRKHPPLFEFQET
jgi:amino acid transporter